MPTHEVNLDALIQREDFEKTADVVAEGGKPPLFKVEELASDKLYFKVLRKPDFQRHTSNWTPRMIVDLVKSFLDGELIPSIIIWHSRKTGNVFVIDGAHRLSALIAWVNDDYGAGSISRQFFGDDVPEKQQDFHKKTQSLMNGEIGDFRRLLDIGLNKVTSPDPVAKRRANAITTRQPDIQKVEGDAKTAEESFYKINSVPATIDKTELALIRARAKPNAIATRAILSRGTSRTYWEKFSPEVREEIEKLAIEASESVFGQLSEISSTSPDVPRAGQPYSQEAFYMVLDVVNLVNEITPAMWVTPPTRRSSVQRLEDDADGATTIQYIREVIKAGHLIAGSKNRESLGLDQAVYSWGATGGFHPVAFLSTMQWARELVKNDRLPAFTKVRHDFEEFLVKHKRFINALGHSKGSRTRPLDSFLTMYRTVFESLRSGEREDESIRQKLYATKQLKTLQTLPDKDREKTPGKKFPKSVQAAAVINTILESRGRCAECGARIPPDSRSKDHKTLKSEGGLGTLDNLAFTHPYCNTGYKQKRLSESSKQSKQKTR